ncbi:CDP-paratose 2-epimerase [Candidatus Peribacteria bacterium RIFCSPLOWO2_01_FULL_51_18]|nr:MAG: CDP-paratose 2-epimerase [Candidatus Peribacteria bacterium RIFCSPHIGHO2_02_FULL_51_15]OGJ65489.1 MAG: CDP-paratose 2-epimerase [Candidatus Peribacteria bacterium RIFCSPLOWO2_01_FULL_51_18]OGJ67601.1 MAG: CDP-paratose 2-epimerase [Candidatus Peribacteria bacterium RIFCSPLOWO2_02_FULL_51_10]
MSKKILITGGAGFIGVNAAKRFIEEGFDITILDNLSRRGTDVNVKFLEDNFKGKFRLVKADVRTDRPSLNELAGSHDAILHLAAQVAVTTSVADPRTDFEINALGTFNVLEAARASARKPAVLYASTNKVFGGLEHLRVTLDGNRVKFKDDIPGVDESCQLDFHSPYGCSKGAADQYVRDYARIYGLKTVVFRQSCIYGPHQLGVEDQGWVAWFLIAAMFGRPLTVYGTGKQVRDILYVDDLVDLYIRAIKNLDRLSSDGEIFNVGGGMNNSMSLLEFLNFIKNNLKLPVEWSFSDWRPGDQPIFVSDNAKAKKVLGWEPATDLRVGIPRLFEWLNDNRGMLEGFYK